MPIPLISEIIPQNNGQFALIDDNNIRGGFHCVANLTERNSISNDKRKYGMKVFVQSTDLAYTLKPDLTTWEIDRSLTVSLQDAYDNGNEITVIDNKPIIFKNGISEVLKISSDNSVEFGKTLCGRDYTSNINANVITNSTIVIDVTDARKYRAIHYCYTVANSDNSGYETGQLYIIHDGLFASIYAIMGNNQGVPCGISFNAELSGNDLNLVAESDNSGPFSRVVHLFKIALG